MSRAGRGVDADELDDPADRAAVREIAEIERKLRRSSVENVHVDVSLGGARIYFDTWEVNEHFRGTITASMCREITEGDEWAVSTVHDPMESSETDGLVFSTFTLCRADEVIDS